MKINTNIIKLVLLVLIILLISNCNNKPLNLNLLTNEPCMVDIANLFNANHQKIKVTIDYYNTVETNKEKNIFYSIKNNYFNNYDLIVGNSVPEVIIDSNKFCNLKNYSTKLKNINNLQFYKLFYDYLEKNNDYSICYTLDFPVIIARKDCIPKDLSNDEILLDDIVKLFTNVNQNAEIDEDRYLRLGFIPSASTLKDIDLFFIFKAKISHFKNLFSNDADFMNAFNFIFKYDENYNFGNETVNQYLNRFDNVDRNFYLKQKIISFDFIPIPARTRCSRG